MDELENRLYELMASADTQQQAITAALDSLKQRDADMARTVALLQSTTQTLTPAIEQATRRAAESAIQSGLAAPLENLAQTLETAARPVLAGLGRVGQQADAAAGQLQDAVRVFGWRWVALASATAAGVLLCLFLGVEGLLWWDRSQVAELRSERNQLAADVAEARQTLAVLEKKTGGVRYEESSKGRFLVMQGGYEPGWECNGKTKTPCIKLK